MGASRADLDDAQVEILRAAHNVVIGTQMAVVAESEETAAQLEAAAESSGTVGGNEETVAQLEAAAGSSSIVGASRTEETAALTAGGNCEEQRHNWRQQDKGDQGSSREAGAARC